MSIHAPGGRTWRLVALAAAVLVVIVGVGSGYMISSATTTSTSASPTTTTVPPEKHQLGWTVVSTSRRGVMVDVRNFQVGAVTFRALRMRARTTLLRWHVGAGDPNAWAKAPADAGPKVNWPNEGLAGVVAVFNGGFKQSANAGGSAVDAVTLVSLVQGDMTIVINRYGHWEMGVWGTPHFPTPGFDPISYRQNLAPLVLNGRATPLALSGNWNAWGSPLGNNPLEARTGLGVDAQGNLIYVATMQGTLSGALARALVDAGALNAMQLDINPYWPILGAAKSPVHHAGASYSVLLAGSQHSPNVYDVAWSRDFFVALQESQSWACNWASPGLRGGVSGVQPQPLALVGPGCRSVKRPPPTTSTSTTTTTTTTTLAPPSTTSP